MEGLFKTFEKVGPNAHKTKQDLVEKKPPANVVVGVPSAIVDKAEDTGRRTVRRILGRT